MSTRCMIKFGEKRRGGSGKLVADAAVYQHSDGYPEGEHGVPAKLARFFEAVEKDTDDTRFGDSEYLAAKWIVWATQYDREAAAKWREKTGRKLDEKDGPLNFLGHGISLREHGDVEYIYFVDCSTDAALSERKTRPRVLWRRAGAKKYRTKLPKEAA